MHFTFTPLPLAAQFSKIYGIAVEDFDNDSIQDLLIAGNFYPYRVQLGSADASLGLLLKGGADHSYMPIKPSESGCYVGGDVRAMVTVNDKTNNRRFVFGKNDGQVQVLKLNQ